MLRATKTAKSTCGFTQEIKKIYCQAISNLCSKHNCGNIAQILQICNESNIKALYTDVSKGATLLYMVERQSHPPSFEETKKKKTARKTAKFTKLQEKECM